MNTQAENQVYKGNQFLKLYPTGEKRFREELRKPRPRPDHVNTHYEDKKSQFLITLPRNKKLKYEMIEKICDELKVDRELKLKVSGAFPVDLDLYEAKNYRIRILGVCSEDAPNMIELYNFLHNYFTQSGLMDFVKDIKFEKNKFYSTPDNPPELFLNYLTEIFKNLRTKQSLPENRLDELDGIVKEIASEIKNGTSLNDLLQGALVNNAIKEIRQLPDEVLASCEQKINQYGESVAKFFELEVQRAKIEKHKKEREEKKKKIAPHLFFEIKMMKFLLDAVDFLTSCTSDELLDYFLHHLNNPHLLGVEPGSEFSLKLKNLAEEINLSVGEQRAENKSPEDILASESMQCAIETLYLVKILQSEDSDLVMKLDATEEYEAKFCKKEDKEASVTSFAKAVAYVVITGIGCALNVPFSAVKEMFKSASQDILGCSALEVLKEGASTGVDKALTFATKVMGVDMKYVEKHLLFKPDNIKEVSCKATQLAFDSFHVNSH